MMTRWLFSAPLLLLAGCSGGSDDTDNKAPTAQEQAADTPAGPSQNAPDCGARPGTDLTALVIDAKTLRFFESAGDLARVRDRDANRIVADYKFSGEGQQWDRLMLLGLADGGKTLVRRDYGDGAAPDAMRYTRCA